MGFEIDLSRKMKLLLKDNGKHYIGLVKTEFGRSGQVIIKREIIKDLNTGISPVHGEGKFQKYSDSYRQEIAKGTSKRMKRATGKSKSPATLRLSGGLHKSLSSQFSGNSLIIKFTNFLAEIHNDKGAGRSKVIRRMLPTKSGEKFNANLQDVIIGQLRRAVDKVAKLIN